MTFSANPKSSERWSKRPQHWNEHSHVILSQASSNWRLCRYVLTSQYCSTYCTLLAKSLLILGPLAKFAFLYIFVWIIRNIIGLLPFINLFNLCSNPGKLHIFLSSFFPLAYSALADLRSKAVLSKDFVGFKYHGTPYHLFWHKYIWLSPISLVSLSMCELNEEHYQIVHLQDQRKRCERLRDKFSKSVSRHLTNVFVHLGNDTDRLEAGGGPAAFGGELLRDQFY